MKTKQLWLLSLLLVAVLLIACTVDDEWYATHEIWQTQYASTLTASPPPAELGDVGFVQIANNQQVVCSTITPTAPACPVIVVTATPGVTDTPIPSATATQMQPTPTQIATLPVTPTSVPLGPNLIKNGGMEAPYINTLHGDGHYHIVPEYWQAWYCDGCPALARGEGNPEDLVMGRPEYKPAAAAQGPLGRDWYSGRNGVTWFCFQRVCQGGVFQAVTVPAGSFCELSAMYRSWSNNDDVEGSDGDYWNSLWYVRVALYGNTDWRNTAEQIKSEVFKPSYDTWSEIKFSFHVPKNSTRVVVFFENTRKWPVINNDNYLDAATLRCG